MHPLAPKGPMPRRTARVRSCGQLCDICVAPRGALCYRHDLFTANIDSGDGMPIQLPRDHPDSLIACMYMCSALTGCGLRTLFSSTGTWNTAVDKFVCLHHTTTSHLQPGQQDSTVTCQNSSIRKT